MMCDEIPLCCSTQLSKNFFSTRFVSVPLHWCLSNPAVYFALLSPHKKLFPPTLPTEELTWWNQEFGWVTFDIYSLSFQLCILPNLKPPPKFDNLIVQLTLLGEKFGTAEHCTWSTSDTVFPRIFSGETILFWIWPYLLWPLVTVPKSAKTIQGRKLFKGGNYSRKYGMYIFCSVI